MEIFVAFRRDLDVFYDEMKDILSVGTNVTIKTLRGIWGKFRKAY